MLCDWICDCEIMAGEANRLDRVDSDGAYPRGAGRNVFHAGRQNERRNSAIRTMNDVDATVQDTCRHTPDVRFFTQPTVP